MERRAFIKASCSICLLGFAGLSLHSLPALAAGKNKVFKTTVNDKNELEIPAAIFAESTLQIIRVKGWEYDVALHRKEDGTYAAFLMKCTHMDNQVAVTGDGFVCNMHGSRYDKEGNVLNGPAELPLTQYKTRIEQDTIIISE
ncbi:MAG: Rieske (2Fe-2S) protein [Chitinophagaceae bacterium]